MATGRWAMRASCGALAVWLLAGCGGQLAQTRVPAAAPAVKPAVETGEIRDILIDGSDETVQITIVTSAKAAYSLVQQLNPPRLMLDLVGASPGSFERTILVDRGVVNSIRPAASGTNSSIEILLTAEALYDVEGRGDSVVLNIAPKSTAVERTPPAAAPAPTEAPAEPVATGAVEPVVAAAAPEAAPAPEQSAPAAPSPAAAPTGPRALTAIGVEKSAAGLVVTLQGNGPLPHEYFLVEGKSLVVDIAGAVNKVWPMKKKVDDAWVAQIRIGEHTQPKMATRVVFDLKKVGDYRVEGVGDRIVVAFGAPALAPRMEEGVGVVQALNLISEVSCQPLDAVTRLEIRTAVKADYTIVDSGDPAKVIVEVANAKIADSDRKTIDLASFGREVVKVNVFPYTRGNAQFVRIVAHLRQPVPFRAIAESDRVVVDFERTPATAVAAASATAPAEPAVPAAPAVVAVADPAPTAAAALAVASAVVTPAAKIAEPKTAAAEEAPPTAPIYTGRRLSLDFKDADVNDILRLISEVSGLNFVAGPEVKGQVTIKLTDVPWDLALDIILKTNQPQLAQIRESENIVRITTSDKILDEEQRRRRIEEDKKKTIDAQQALEPLVTKSYSISYAKAKDIKDFIEKSFSSDRGKGLIQFDERTNILIIQDLASRIAEIDRVIQSLDTPTPAVLVEARIVEVDSSFGQQVGVQWNAAGVKDAAHGNATEYAFPNSVKVGGTQGGVDGSTYMVNLPAAAAVGGVGFSFGHIANTLSLDLRISAGEKLGKIKILSNPKVLVIQNQKAVINLGSQLPIPKTDSSGNRTVEWKDVGIKLEVQPQVTNDKRVFMDIKIEKSSQGENVQTTEGAMFSINTSRADTKVLIADGETTVIGGIFIQENNDSSDSVPGLSKIPIFGWFFRNRANSERKRELMIFLTPRLITI